MSGFPEMFKRMGIAQKSPEEVVRIQTLENLSDEIKSRLVNALDENYTIANSFVSLVNYLQQNADYTEVVSNMKTRYAEQKDKLKDSEREYILKTLVPKFEEDYGIKIGLE
jgi:hypothetical protein